MTTTNGVFRLDRTLHNTTLHTQTCVSASPMDASYSPSAVPCRAVEVSSDWNVSAVRLRLKLWRTVSASRIVSIKYHCYKQWVACLGFLTPPCSWQVAGPGNKQTLITPPQPTQTSHTPTISPPPKPQRKRENPNRKLRRIPQTPVSTAPAPAPCELPIPSGKEKVELSAKDPQGTGMPVPRFSFFFSFVFFAFSVLSGEIAEPLQNAIGR